MAKEIKIRESILSGLLHLVSSENGIDLSGIEADTNDKQMTAAVLLCINHVTTQIKPRYFVSDMNRDNVTIAVAVGESMITGETFNVTLRIKYTPAQATEASSLATFAFAEARVTKDNNVCDASSQKSWGGTNYQAMHDYVAENAEAFRAAITKCLKEEGNATFIKNFEELYTTFPALEN